MKKLSLSFLSVLSVSDAQHIEQQEMNLWLKLESSLQSTQKEIDGLKTLVSKLEADCEKQTRELTLSREDYSRLRSLQESTANSFSQLSTNYVRLKEGEKRLKKALFVLAGLGLLTLLLNIVNTILWAKGIWLPRLLEIWM